MSTRNQTEKADSSLKAALEYFAAGISRDHVLSLAEEQGYTIDEEDINAIMDYLDANALEDVAVDAILEWAEDHGLTAGGEDEEEACAAGGC